MPDEADGFTLFGVEGSRDVRSLRFVEEGADEGASASAADEAAESPVAGRVDVEATGASTGAGGVDKGEGALSEMLLVRRYIPESCRFSSSKF